MHHISQAYHEGADFPYRQQAPAITYMLACSPRSGSTHLALALWRTGCLGAPMEYLHFPHPSGIFKRLGGGSPQIYWYELQRLRASPNGVFGFKMFLSSYRRVAHIYPDLLPLIKSDHVVYLVRRDKIAQAVSHAKATQSGSWFYESAVEPRPASYDYDLIDRCYREAIREHDGWEMLFRQTDCRPFTIVYEDFIEDVDGTIKRIAEHLGVNLERGAVLENLISLDKQSDSVSKCWAELYVADKCQRGS